MGAIAHGTFSVFCFTPIRRDVLSENDAITSWLRLISTSDHLTYISISDVYKVLKSLVCCLKGVRVHPYTVAPAKLPPDLASQGHLRSENIAKCHV